MLDCRAIARTEGKTKLSSAAPGIQHERWQKDAQIKGTEKEYGRKVGNR
jgi:hypothetical protein